MLLNSQAIVVVLRSKLTDQCLLFGRLLSSLTNAEITNLKVLFAKELNVVSFVNC